jgi:hypothetical protein
MLNEEAVGWATKEAPLPNPLPARPSRGEGEDRRAHGAARHPYLVPSKFQRVMGARGLGLITCSASVWCRRPIRLLREKAWL